MYDKGSTDEAFERHRIEVAALQARVKELEALLPLIGEMSDFLETEHYNTCSIRRKPFLCTCGVDEVWEKVNAILPEVNAHNAATTPPDKEA